MNEVLKIMNEDHKKLEFLFNKLLSAFEAKQSDPTEIFTQFQQILQKHFIWEEKILFPLFEKRAGLSGVDTIFVLRNEHHQMNKMFITKIENMLSENRLQDLQSLITGLEEMLTMHRQMETDIFYPWFDEILEDGEKETVVDKLREI